MRNSGKYNSIEVLYFEKHINTVAVIGESGAGMKFSQWSISGEQVCRQIYIADLSVFSQTNFWHSMNLNIS